MTNPCAPHVAAATSGRRPLAHRVWHRIAHPHRLARRVAALTGCPPPVAHGIAQALRAATLATGALGTAAGGVAAARAWQTAPVPAWSTLAVPLPGYDGATRESIAGAPVVGSGANAPPTRSSGTDGLPQGVPEPPGAIVLAAGVVALLATRRHRRG